MGNPLDGIPCEFYNVMSDTIGDDLGHMAYEEFSTRCLSEFINQGLIKIIPKNTLRDTIGGLSPITLLSVA